MQTKVEHRPGDTVVAVAAKSGTTWAMNIFHQLRTGGDPDFKDIYAEVPWPQFKERPDQTDEELLERWKKMPDPRGFKSHSSPGPDGAAAPEIGAFLTYREDMKYLVIMRNPEEAIVSYFPFLAAHNPKLWELWNVTEMRETLMRPTFKAFFDEIVLPGFPHMPRDRVPPGGLLTMFYFSFLNNWWPFRGKPNVLMLHFSDMVRDHEASLRKIASFLGMEPTPEQWPKVLEYTSFRWMKEHEEKFEVHTLLPFPLLLPGGMVRKGCSGQSAEDGVTPEISAQIREWAEKMVPDPAARLWLFEGCSQGSSL